MKFLKKTKAKISTIGEMSTVPRLGIKLLINLKGGSVNLWEISRTEYTKRLLVLITLNATNQLATALTIKIQI